MSMDNLNMNSPLQDIDVNREQHIALLRLLSHGPKEIRFSLTPTISGNAYFYYACSKMSRKQLFNANTKMVLRWVYKLNLLLFIRPLFLKLLHLLMMQRKNSSLLHKLSQQ